MLHQNSRSTIVRSTTKRGELRPDSFKDKNFAVLIYRGCSQVKKH